MLDILADMADRFHETGDPDPDTIHVGLSKRVAKDVFSPNHCKTWHQY